MRLGLLFGFVALIVSCTPSGPIKVYVDDRFRSHELLGVVRGLEAWRDAVGVDFAIEVLPIDEVVEHDVDGAVRTFSIFRGPDAQNCFGVESFAGYDDYRRRKQYSRICLNAVYINETPLPDRDGWASVAAHEIGHALGLGHSPVEGDTMFPTYGSQSETPTANDVAAYEKEHTI